MFGCMCVCELRTLVARLRYGHMHRPGHPLLLFHTDGIFSLFFLPSFSLFSVFVSFCLLFLLMVRNSSLRLFLVPDFYICVDAMLLVRVLSLFSIRLAHSFFIIYILLWLNNVKEACALSVGWGEAFALFNWTKYDLKLLFYWYCWMSSCLWDLLCFLRNLNCCF